MAVNGDRGRKSSQILCRRVPCRAVTSDRRRVLMLKVVGGARWMKEVEDVEVPQLVEIRPRTDSRGAWATQSVHCRAPLGRFGNHRRLLGESRAKAQSTHSNLQVPRTG